MHIIHINLARGFRGGERQTALLIEGLARHKIQQTLLVRHDSPLCAIVSTVPGLSIHKLRKPYVFHLKQKTNGDIMHAHETKAAQWAYLHYLCYRTPYMITRRVPHRPKNNFFTRRVYRHATKLVALSRAIHAVLSAYQPRADIEIIPSMYQPTQVDSEHLQQLQKKYVPKNDGKGSSSILPFIVGHVGAYVDHHKGQNLIIAAARTLQFRYPELLFLLVGDGPDKKRLMQQAADLKNVCFAGQQTQVLDYFALFDLFVFPSLHEGLGSSLLDAIAHKLPMIASKVGGITDIITHEKSGLLIEPGNAAQLATAIVRLRENPDLRQKMVQQASLTLERYSQERVAQQYYKIYQAIQNASCATSDTLLQ